MVNWRSPRKAATVLGVEIRAGRVHRLGVEPLHGGLGGRLRVLQRLVARGSHRRAHIGLQAVELGSGRGAGFDEQPACPAERIPAVLRGPFGRGAVRGFVVRSRVGVGPDGVRVQQRRPAPFPAPAHRLARGPVAVGKVGSVALYDLEIREARQQPRDAAAGGLHFDRHRNGVFVVLDHEEDRQLQVAGRVERLPELALGGGAVASGADDDLVLGEGPEVSAQFGGDSGAQPRLGGAHGLQELGPRRRGGRHDVEAGVPVVAGHLAAAAGRVGLGAHPLQQLLHGRHPECQRQGAVPVVEVEPVRSGANQVGKGDLHRLVSGPRDQEEDLALLVELCLAVVDGAGRDHRPVPGEQLVRARYTGFELGAEIVFRCGHVLPDWCGRIGG